MEIRKLFRFVCVIYFIHIQLKKDCGDKMEDRMYYVLLKSA